MPYSVKIEQLDADGVPMGSPTTQAAASQSEAVTFMRRAVELARTLPRPMQFSLCDPDGRLVMSYVGGSEEPDALGTLAR